ncbi:MAG: LacI family DNA-binding transcriptional regulator [Clostridium sp.]|uniref:LacI family DNA-binding transcriptional regulator n=1 Tax=Clostridium sp. TaxID=1506 RepID=UPI003F39B04B
MKVTIKDVAKEANVATSTVSRVLSNSSKISEETKKKVNDAIKKLNYVPSAIARGLANNKTNILAVVVPEGAEEIFSNPFFIQALKGVSICAEKNNYYIMYAFEEANSNNDDWIRKFSDSNLVDGICLFRAKENDNYVKYLKKIAFPFVVIGKPEDDDNMLWVDNDNFKAVYELVKELVSIGHSRIAFIGGHNTLNVSKNRLNGYISGLKDNGIEIKSELIYEAEDFKEKFGFEGAMEILKNSNPTAIIAGDDLLAFGVQKALNVLNKSNIAVVGFNNIPFCMHSNPTLSSVDINSEKLGYYAAKLLIDRLNKVNERKRNYIIETELIKRDSFK